MAGRGRRRGAARLWPPTRRKTGAQSPAARTSVQLCLPISSRSGGQTTGAAFFAGAVAAIIALNSDVRDSHAGSLHGCLPAGAIFRCQARLSEKLRKRSRTMYKTLALVCLLAGTGGARLAPARCARLAPAARTTRLLASDRRPRLSRSIVCAIGDDDPPAPPRAGAELAPVDDAAALAAADAEPTDGIQMELVRKQLVLFWRMAQPYFRESDDAKRQLAGVLALTFLNAGLSVLFSFVGRDFWSALSAKDTTRFYELMLRYGAALVVGTPISVQYRFARSSLALSWREWMTARLTTLYLADRNYYEIEVGGAVDNPDQRLTDDVRSFTRTSLDFFITVRLPQRPPSRAPGARPLALARAGSFAHLAPFCRRRPVRARPPRPSSPPVAHLRDRPGQLFDHPPRHRPKPLWRDHCVRGGRLGVDRRARQAAGRAQLQAADARGGPALPARAAARERRVRRLLPRRAAGGCRHVRPSRRGRRQRARAPRREALARALHDGVQLPDPGGARAGGGAPLLLGQHRARRDLSVGRRVQPHPLRPLHPRCAQPRTRARARSCTHTRPTRPAPATDRRVARAGGAVGVPEHADAPDLGDDARARPATSARADPRCPGPPASRRHLVCMCVPFLPSFLPSSRSPRCLAPSLPQ